MKHIIETLEQVEQMVGSLAEKGALDIERDLLLEKIRKIYAEVLKLEPAKEEPCCEAEEQVVVVPVVSETELAFEPEEVVEEIAFEDELVEEPVEEEPVVEETVVVEDSIKEEFIVEEPIEEEPIEEPNEDVSDGVLALYDDEEEEEIVAESVEEEPTEEPEEEEFVIEEAEEGEVQFEEQFDFEDEESELSGSVSLRSTIGVNDKIILMRDLFNGNNEYYDRVITKLDSFSSLDEAMIFIHDNYHWNPQSEGARLLVELLARKLF